MQAGTFQQMELSTNKKKLKIPTKTKQKQQPKKPHQKTGKALFCCLHFPVTNSYFGVNFCVFCRPVANTAMSFISDYNEF